MEMDTSIFGSPGRTSAEDKRDLSKSWQSGNSDLWQSRQSRSAEAELHIFGSPGRDEMRKWPYPYLEVLAEHVQKMNEINWHYSRYGLNPITLMLPVN